MQPGWFVSIAGLCLLLLGQRLQQAPNQRPSHSRLRLTIRHTILFDILNKYQPDLYRKRKEALANLQWYGNRAAHAATSLEEPLTSNEAEDVKGNGKGLRGRAPPVCDDIGECLSREVVLLMCRCVDYGDFLPGRSALQ